MAPESKLLQIHNLFMVFVLIISSLFQSHQTAASSLALDGCQERCGQVEIPYPFGINKGCYLDKDFEVTCNDSTNSPSLLLFKMKIDHISLSERYVRVSDFPVLSMSFNRSSAENLSVLPTPEFIFGRFSVSYIRNKFVAVGCDLYAYVVNNRSKEFITGCGSLCNRTDLVTSTSPCSGFGCCQSSIPKDFSTFNLWVNRISTSKKSWPLDSCGFFFFVAKDVELDLQHSFPSCNQRYHVPLVFNWTIGNTSCSEARKTNRFGCGQNSNCYDNDDEGRGYRCKCTPGYHGNPYLTKGCQDIDECADPRNNDCREREQCVNTIGSYYCQPSRGHGTALFIPLGIGLAVGLLILTAISLWLYRKIKKMKEAKVKQNHFKRNGGLLLQQHISSSTGNVFAETKLFKIEELEKATDKFNTSRIVGKGGLGTVYKGMLTDGNIVAVKRSNILDESHVDQFINEVFILSCISHRHIVKLFGCCLEAEVPLLVYEYVSNGTLSHHLHEENVSTISWENRLRIAAEVAGAIAYLHSCASTAIFHRDIKSNNILLDENYRAVVSDFGLSRSVSIDKTHLTTQVGGTFGYLDPEYFQSGQLNDKSDVYAFGVVLAELLTGQKAIITKNSSEGLAHRLRFAVKENRLYEVVEKLVANEGQKEDILAVAKLAKRCLKLKARSRPSMKEVASELEQLRRTISNQSVLVLDENFQDGNYDSVSERSSSCDEIAAEDA